MPKVSVIVPCYQVEAFLDRCVSSIQNQTLTDIEIILIDDGGKDRTAAICDELAEKDQRIRVIHQKNKGLSGARNAGLQIAVGEYIGFVDSDDFIHPQMYEILYNAAVKNSVEVVIGDACEVRTIPRFEQYDENNIQQNPISPEQYAKNMFCAHGDWPDWKWLVVCNKLYKRELCDNIQFRNLSCEDVMFNCEVLMKVETFLQVNRVVYYWWENPNSITRGAFGNHQRGMLDTYDTVRQMCAAKNPEWGYYVLEREVKNLLSFRYEAEKTDNEKVVNEIVVNHRKKLVRVLLTEKRMSAAKKIVYSTFLYIPFTYKLFRGLHLKIQ